MVTAELGVNALQGRVTVGLGLLDAVTEVLPVGVVLGGVLRLGHLDGMCRNERVVDLDRCWTGLGTVNSWKSRRVG